jgi:hypothetical protein
MFGVSASYFTVAIFGENIENRELSMNTTEQQQALPQEVETHNESGESSLEHLNKTQNMETAESKEGMEGTGVHQETASENQRRALELSLSVTAGIGYAIIGLWMVLDKRNSRFPFIVAIAGSIVLLVIYSASRSVGIYSLGIEPVGILDLIVAMLQVIIIACSLYVLLAKIYILKQ